MAHGLRSRIFVPSDPTDEELATAKWLAAENIYNSLRKAGLPLEGEIEFEDRMNYDGVAPESRPREICARHYPAKQVMV